MIEKSSRTDGKYIAVHLRFEEVGTDAHSIRLELVVSVNI